MKKHAAAKKAKKKGAPHPQWDGVFKANLTNVPGYAYAVAHHGRLVAEGAVGSARTSLNAPATPWTTSTRINLASVSKCVTTVALLRLLSHRGISINQPTGVRPPDPGSLPLRLRTFLK
jgi:CubicO group peptidase (beta-lactamase class C family)